MAESSDSDEVENVTKGKKVIWFCPSLEKSLSDFKRRHCLSWETSKPSSGHTLESSLFCFQGIRCWLSLTCKAGWYKLRLNCSETATRPSLDCSVTVYLEKSSGYILPEFSNKRFCLQPTTCIWCCHETQILSQIPDFGQEKRLSFLIIEDIFQSKCKPTLEDKISERSDVRLWVTYAGSCLNALANEVWKIIHRQSDHDLNLKGWGGHDVNYRIVIKARRGDICKHSPVIQEGLQGDTFKAFDFLTFFEAFLACLCIGKLPDDTRESVVRWLYMMAKGYEVKWLMKQCHELLLKEITVNNVAKIIHVASYTKDLALRDAATKYIIDNKVPLLTYDEEEIYTIFSGDFPWSKPKSVEIKAVPLMMNLDEPEYYLT